MEGRDSSTHHPLLVNWYLAFISCWTLWIAFVWIRRPNGWTPGDWLINYEGGFVRRGLPGEGILVAARELHISPLALGILLPLVLYGVIYFAVWKLYRRSSWKLWTIAALVSPATLAFPILDPVGAFRKELIYLAGLSLLLVYLTRKTVSDLFVAIYLTVVCLLSILSHEALLPYMLYYLGALLIALHNPRRVAKIALLPLLVVGVALSAVVHHRGNVAIEQSICSSLGPVPAIVCGGAIAYLANAADVARQDVVRDVYRYHYLVYFPIVASLGLLPMVLGIATLYNKRSLRYDLHVLCAIIVLAAAASIPIFLYAMDWGRWIYIHIFSIFLILVFLDNRTQSNIEMRRPEKPRPRILRRRWVAAGLLIYATCWNIPHYGNYPKKGYLNTPFHLLKKNLDKKSRPQMPPDSVPYVKARDRPQVY